MITSGFPTLQPDVLLRSSGPSFHSHHSGNRYVRFGCFVEGVDDFDAGAFRLAPGEAITMDPQTRILLEQTQVRVFLACCKSCMRCGQGAERKNLVVAGSLACGWG